MKKPNPDDELKQPIVSRGPNYSTYSLPPRNLKNDIEKNSKRLFILTPCLFLLSFTSGLFTGKIIFPKEDKNLSHISPIVALGVTMLALLSGATLIYFIYATKKNAYHFFNHRDNSDQKKELVQQASNSPPTPVLTHQHV